MVGKTTIIPITDHCLNRLILMMTLEEKTLREIWKALEEGKPLG